MKKMLAAAACLLLLCGCGAEKIDLQEIGAYYAGLTDYETRVRVTAAEEISMEFLLDFARTPEKDEITIVEPEGAAGIRARLTPGKTELVYQGAAAETLLPGLPGCTPCDMLSGVLHTLAGEIPSSAARTRLADGEAILLTYVWSPAPGSTGEKMIWLAPDYSLLESQLFLNGDLLLCLQVEK